MSRDEQIIRADHRATRFEGSANLRVVRGSFVRKIQDLNVTQIFAERHRVLLPPGGDLYSVKEF